MYVLINTHDYTLIATTIELNNTTTKYQITPLLNQTIETKPI